MVIRDEIRVAFIARNQTRFVRRIENVRTTKRARRLVIRGESPLKGHTHHESDPQRRAGLERPQQRVPPTRAHLTHVAKVRMSWPVRRLAARRALGPLLDTCSWRFTNRYSRADPGRRWPRERQPR